MVFALLFFVSFVVGLVTYWLTERWWLGGVLCTLLVMMVAFVGFSGAPLKGVAIYFGIPVVFFGSLFGAYIVQLRRAPDLDDLSDEPKQTAHNITDTEK